MSLVARLARAVFFLVLVLLLVLVGNAARRLAERTWLAVVEYPSPFTEPLVTTARGRWLADRVVVIVVDGLRVDAFEQMTLPAALRERAAVGQARAVEPSLSFPGWTAIVSGAPPEISGVTTNWYRGPVRVDHLFAAAKRAGLRTAAVGSPGWFDLFGETIDRFVAVEDPPYTDLRAIHNTNLLVARRGERVLEEFAPDLLVLHFPAPDLMGHGFGGASRQYRETVQGLNVELQRLVFDVFDLETTAVLITSDHGHIDAGGHGGWEDVVLKVPLLLAGAGIQPVGGLDARHADIAPTVAALLGVPIPAHSLGRPLVEAMAAVPAGLPERWRAQQTAFLRVYARAVLGRATTPTTSPADPDPLETIMLAADEYAVQMAAWRAEALQRDRLRRLPEAILAGLLPLVGVLVFRPRRDLLPALAGVMVFFGVAVGMFFGRGHYFSLSIINREELLEPFFLARSLEAAVALGVAALVAGWAARRRGIGTGAAAGVTTAYLVAYALAVGILGFYVRWGFSFPWYIPDLREGFAFYIGLLALTPVGVLAPAAVVVSLVGFGISRMPAGLSRGRPR